MIEAATSDVWFYAEVRTFVMEGRRVLAFVASINVLIVLIKASHRFKVKPL